MRNKILQSVMTAKNITRTILTGLLILATTSMALAQGLSPAIQIQPSSSVEVGEEVFFSATGTTYPDATILSKARYEWDFGDGYYHRFDPTVKTITLSGIAVTHYYMKPGYFTVKLKVTVWAKWDAAGTPIGSPLATKTDTIAVHVTGEAPMPGFEIQRAPFDSRLAQYLYVQIPTAYRGNQTKLLVKLERSNGMSIVLFQENNLSDEERVYLDHKPLAQGDYVVVAELLNARGKRITGGLWRDKFSKCYPTIPKVGIDENNSFRLNGELFFPIGPFMTSVSEFDKFKNQAIVNMFHTEGYYLTHTPTTWNNSLYNADKRNLVAIGPGRGDYSGPFRFAFNHNTDRMADYVRFNKDQQAMFTWVWQDEPNIGGRAQKVYPPTLAAWAYVCHREDPQHPAYNSFYGADWSRYYGTGLNAFDYLASAQFFGGKKWMQDISGFDIYPIPFRLHPSLNLVSMGPYAVYLDALDRLKSNNKNLAPIIPAINPSNRNPNETVLIHSAEQVYSEAWMNVIHGAKGIIWFQYFDPPSIRWEAMKKFANQMRVLAPVVLESEPARIVKDDANTPLNRVDTLIREVDGNVYIFAARVTEPDPIKGAKYQGIEPDYITVNFIVDEINGNAVAEVMDEGRKVTIINGRFTDEFVKNAVHIYKINMMPSKR